MVDSYPLITTIVASIVFAFIFGFMAKKLKLPSIVGYLFAGVLLGSHTPGFTADIHIAKQLAEIGVILLMFGVGLHFSLRDLISVHRIALPGAIFQILAVVFIGFCFVTLTGGAFASAIVFGLCLSVASTIVTLRSLEQRHLLTSEAGKIVIGWLIVEDVVMVFAIVLLPVFADIINSGKAFDLKFIMHETIFVIIKISAFAIVMVSLGRKFLPKLLVTISKTKSRELMSLGTMAIALGFAFVAYTLFDASFALGAFLAGLVLNESEIGRKSAEQSLPMRDTFAVLFFISVGMLFDPTILLREPLKVLMTFLVVTGGNALTAYLFMRFFKQTKQRGLLIAFSLAQIGEFSFIFAGMALKLDILTPQLYDLILASALLSIAVNPFLFRMTTETNRTN